MSAKSLPVTDEILDRLCDLIFTTDTRAAVFVGETGSGKTTLVPPAIYRRLVDPFREVIVLLPTRIATIAAATYVAQQMGVKLGGLVGYRTGHANEKKYSSATRITFMTVAYELALLMNGRRNGIVVIMDELHNYNEHQEATLAWLEREIRTSDDVKLITMSATIDANRLSHFLGDCPIMTVSGRSFPVVRRSTNKDAAATTARLLQEGKNVLTFVEGKPQIREMSELVSQLVPGKAEIIPLHADLSNEQQALVYPKYSKPKCVIATNVGESSITIPDIDAVVSNGRVRIPVVINGVVTLIVVDTPQDSMDQQAGRAGRTKHGEAWDCSGKPFAKRLKHQIPEIQRVPLGQLVVRLAAVGVVASDLKFLHLPDADNIKLAEIRLKSLGALDPRGQITETGRLMSRLPVDIHIARMVVEASRRGVLDQVVTIAACVEAKSVRDLANENAPFGGVVARDGWMVLTKEEQSDLLVEYDCYMRAVRMTPEERSFAGIHEKRFLRAVETRDQIVRALRSVEIETVSTNSDRTEVMKACIVGLLDHIYRPIRQGLYAGADPTARKVARGSVISPESHNAIVGIPFSLEVHRRSVTCKKGKGARPHSIVIKDMVDLILFPTILPQSWHNDLTAESAKRKPSNGPRARRPSRTAV